MRFIFTLAILIWLPAPATYAAAAPEEIDFLLATVGDSACTFIRNGKRHSAEDAEAHLRMKYRRGRRYAPTSEKFIERLASQSSLSKKPYYIECEGEEKVPSGQWLVTRLNEYRARSQNGHWTPQ